jgi:hypothetical protein
LGNWPATETRRKESKQYCIVCNTVVLLALPYQGKDIVFRFIIEYSSLRDFYGPLGNNNNTRSIFIGGFLKDDVFDKNVLKLEISCYIILIS